MTWYEEGCLQHIGKHFYCRGGGHDSDMEKDASDDAQEGVSHVSAIG